MHAQDTFYAAATLKTHTAALRRELAIQKKELATQKQECSVTIEKYNRNAQFMRDVEAQQLKDSHVDDGNVS